MDYFSLPVQCLLTGTFVIACMFMGRSITRTNRRIDRFKADMSSLKTSIQAGSAQVTDKLYALPAAGVKVHQVGTAPHNAVVSVSTTPDLQLALNQLNAAFDAVMLKLDRIEALVDALPCKTAD